MRAQIKKGGFAWKLHKTLTVTCKGKDIPSEIVSNISAMDVGDKVFLRDLDIPEGVRVHMTDDKVPIIKIGGQGKVMDVYGTKISFNVKELEVPNNSPPGLARVLGVTVDDGLPLGHELLHRLVQVIPPGDEQTGDHLRVLRASPPRTLPGALPDDIPPFLPLLALPHEQERRPPHRAIQRESLRLVVSTSIGDLFGSFFRAPSSEAWSRLRSIKSSASPPL